MIPKTCLECKFAEQETIGGGVFCRHPEVGFLDNIRLAMNFAPSAICPLKKHGTIKHDDGTIKHDDGKTRWDLLPWDELKDVADVFTIGLNKYGVDNWRHGLAWHRLFRAMIGHAISFWMGKDKNDEDGGVYHLAQVAWNALVLLHYYKNNIGTDTRRKT